MEFKAIVNPFINKVIITTNIDNCEYSVTLFFDDTDEWKSFSLNNIIYDIHYLYEEGYGLNICLYYPLSDGTIKEVKCINEIIF